MHTFQDDAVQSLWVVWAQLSRLAEARGRELPAPRTEHPPGLGAVLERPTEPAEETARARWDNVPRHASSLAHECRELVDLIFSPHEGDTDVS